MSASIRQPAVAGRFYPADVGRLTAFLDEHVTPSRDDEKTPRAVIVPHAGFPFSGATAGMAFSTLRADSCERVIVLGPSHHLEMRGIALPHHTAFRTPLGDVEVDRVACDTIIDGDDFRFVVRDDAHKLEHCVEVELPFLQKLLPNATIVPLVCGEMTIDDIRDTADKLLPLWDEKTVVVVSSDFTHFGAHFGYYPFSEQEAPEKLKVLDGGAIDQIKAGNMEGFIRYTEETGATICGRFPIAVLLAMLEAVDTDYSAELLDYKTSGAMLDDFSSSVSYAALTFTP